MERFGKRMGYWWTILIIQLILIVFDTNALKCYKCQADNGQCKDGQCVTDGGICVKREKNYGNGTWTVIKGCRGAPVVNRTCEYDQSLAPGGQICFCDGADFCNAAYSSTPPLYGILLSMVGFIILIPALEH